MTTLERKALEHVKGLIKGMNPPPPYAGHMPRTDEQNQKREDEWSNSGSRQRDAEGWLNAILDTEES